MKKTLGSVSKSNDHGFNVHYSNTGIYMEDEKTKEKTTLRRERGVFVLDAWLVPFEMAKTKIMKYKDSNGRMRTVKVGTKNNELGFSRPAR